MGFISKNSPLFLTDGTSVAFVKTTNKGNIQVRLPDGHPFAVGQDAGRIFRANGGAHYKGLTELKLTNTATATTTAPVAAAAPAVAVGQIDTSAPLVLSDGTPVTFVKLTPRKGFIQVRLPDGHPFAAGQENGRLFKTDGTRPSKLGRKYGSDFTLANGTASAVAAAPVTTGSFAIVSASGSMLADNIDSFDAAVSAAASFLADGSPLNIVEVTTKVVGTVGITVSRS